MVKLVVFVTQNVEPMKCTMLTTISFISMNFYTMEVHWDASNMQIAKQNHFYKFEKRSFQFVGKDSRGWLQT